MWRFPAVSLRSRLMIVVFLAVLPALISIFYSGLKQRQRALADASTSALVLAQDLSDELEEIVGNTRRILATLAQLPQVVQRDPEATTAVLAKLLKLFEGSTNIVACDPAGHIFASLTSLPRPPNFSDREWFKRAIQTQDFVISDFLTGRITGKPEVILAYPVVDDSGSLQGILHTALHIDWLNQFIARRSLPPGVTCSVIDRNGTILAHYPDPEQLVGKSVANTAFVKRALHETEGVAELPGLNGETYVFGHASLSKLPGSLYTVVGIPEEAAFANANRSLLQNIGLLGSVALLAVIGAWLLGDVFIVRQVNALLRMTREVSSGNLSARTQLSESRGELSRLAEAFDVMAESLQLREIERQRAVESLRESEERYCQTAENIHEVLWMADLEMTRMIYINAAYERIWGRSCSDLMENPRSWLDAVHPEDRGQVEKALKEKAAGGYSVEYRIVRPDRTVRWIWDRGFPIRNQAGEVHRVAGIAQDITERRQAEKSSQQHYARVGLLNQIARSITGRHDLKSLYHVVVQHLEDQLPVAYASVCRYDLENQTLTVLARSRNSQQLIGSRSAPEGVPFPYSTGGMQRLQESEDGIYLADMGDSDEPGVQELHWLGLKSFIAVPLQTEDEMLGLFMVARTEVDAFSKEEFEFLKSLGKHVSLAAHQSRLYEKLQKAYDELRDTQQIVLQQERLRALGQMASGIAHDINNALAPIVGYTDLLLAFDTQLTEAAKEGLRAIRLAGQDIAHTVANMREFYRKREQQEPPSLINLNHLIEQVIDLTRPRWRDIPQEHGIVIEVQTDLQQDLPSLEGSESEIRQALTNLIINAVDAMPKGGTIHFQTSFVGDNLVLAVTDTGIGMDSETRSRCLEPFFTTKGDRGTGLGLAMVSGSMQRHEGSVEIQSEVGQGTSVRLVFAAGRSPAELLVGPAAADPPSPMHILCIDDELLMRELMKQILERDNHMVEVADGGQTGLEAFHAASLRSEPFDVVISDLGMPYVDGREVARLVKQDSPRTPVILLTGWAERIRAEGSLPANVDFVISKPTTVKQIREALRQANGNAGSSAGG